MQFPRNIKLIENRCINAGSLSLIGTPYMEKYIGFWSAYLMCLGMFVAGTIVLVLSKKSLNVRPPQGHIITDAFKAIWMMIKARDMDAAKPSHTGTSLRWDDHFVDELKRALMACKVFTMYPIYWWVFPSVCCGNKLMSCSGSATTSSRTTSSRKRTR
jgi:POT family proton-dependent oligopeptide transporter